MEEEVLTEDSQSPRIRKRTTHPRQSYAGRHRVAQEAEAGREGVGVGLYCVSVQGRVSGLIQDGRWTLWVEGIEYHSLPFTENLL